VLEISQKLQKKIKHECTDNFKNLDYNLITIGNKTVEIEAIDFLMQMYVDAEIAKTIKFSWAGRI